MEAGERRIVEVGAGPVALLVASLNAGPQYSSVLKEIDRAAHEVRNFVRTGQALPL